MKAFKNKKTFASRFADYLIGMNIPFELVKSDSTRSIFKVSGVISKFDFDALPFSYWQILPGDYTSFRLVIFENY